MSLTGWPRGLCTTFRKVHEFQSVDHFQMPGKYIVYAFDKSQIPADMTDLEALKGQVVRIDGALFKVNEVDAHPVSENDHSAIPEDFGLMVTPAG